MPIRWTVLFTLALVASAGAAEETRRFGNWEVSYTPGRFGDKGKVIALTVQDGSALAVRCMNGNLSFALMTLGFGPGRFREGLDVKAKFQADAKSPIDVDAAGLNDKTLQIDLPGPIARQLVDAKEYAFRVTYLSTTFDRVFKAGKGGPKAMAEVFKLCPLPEAK